LNLADPAELTNFLKRNGLLPRKGLGQHFLASQSVVDGIVERASSCRAILEIGPGLGVLTRPISEQVEQLVALEVDAPMVRILKQTAPKAEVIHEDALKVDLAALLGRLPEPRAIVSNMPYFITAPLVTAIVRCSTHFEMAVLMMQREVAERLAAPARSSARGSLSVFVQAHCTITKVVDVPPGAFVPPPKVASTVLELRPRSEILYDEGYFRFVRLGFTQPRKTLANNLSSGLHRGRDEVLSALESVGLLPTARAQELDLDEWARLRAALGA
jgi:16S rRNA (adenine1518-N6/adenine1519-N6)-dimethyltransferase